MGYSLAPGMSFCVDGDRPIFLDLHKDRYFALAGESASAILRLIANQPLVARHRKALETLVRNGVLQRSDHAAPLSPCCRAPRSSEGHFEKPAGSLVPGQLAAAIWELGASQLVLSAFGLARTVAQLERRKSRLRNEDCPFLDERLGAIIAAFCTASLLFTSYKRCLPQSVALMRRLLACGCTADLVFGVMARPFQAHCWVEYQGAVLNDHRDHVINFTPIRVI